jgi:long-subunit acyl-CoA synthetase (AMP-forming)
LGIYSKNRPEWLLSYFGAVRDSITIVTVYDTLGDIA